MAAFQGPSRLDVDVAGSLDREDLKEKFSEEDRSKAWRVSAQFRYGIVHTHIYIDMVCTGMDIYYLRTYLCVHNDMVYTHF